VLSLVLPPVLLP